MSFPITDTPVLIDPVLASRAAGWTGATSNTKNIAFKFLFVVGSNLYGVLSSGDPLSSLGGVFKSTDGGATWTQQDSVNRPLNGFHLLAELDEITGIIYLCYDGVADLHYRINTFDTNTDTYGSVVTSGFTWAVGSTNAELLRQSMGDIYVYYISGSTLVYEKFSTGAWSGSQVTVSSIYNTTILSYAVDAADRMHLLVGPIVTQKRVAYIPIDATGSVGSAVIVYSNGFSIGIAGSGNGVILNGDTICFPYVTGASENDVRVFFGTPLNAPVWTDEAVATVSDRAIINDLQLDGSNNLVSFYTQYNQSGGDPDQLWMNTRTSGVWGTPELVYDLIDNPPPTNGFDPFNNYIHSLNAALFDGRWVFITAAEANPDSGPDRELCAGYFLAESPATVQTLQLNKTVIGGSAVASDFTLTATGPDTLTGAGPQVGPTEVNAGTYELSEDGPSGYEAGAWDCGGATMPTASSVTVPEGGTVVCSITNTHQTLQLVVNISGGTAVPGDVTTTATGPTTITGAGGVGPSSVPTGTFALTSTPLSNYTASSYVCVGGDQSGNNETINPGDMAVCTITYTLIALAVGCPVISNGRVGIPFEALIVVTGGVPPYSFAIIAGTLGPGLTLDTVTGVITGTPTSSGTFSYTVQVTDSADTVVTTTCQISIAAHCPIVLPSTDSCGVTLPAADSCPVTLPQDTCTCPD